MSISPNPSGRRYRWWHAAAVGIAANVASALPAGYNGDERYYEALRLPPGAPPGWVFAPVWAINNVTTLISNLRVANLPTESAGRRHALRAEALHWSLFSAFPFMFFRLRSPVLGALNALASTVVTSYSLSQTRRLDRTAAWFLVPRMIWLAFASYVSVATAIRSDDELINRRPRQLPN